MDLQSSCPVHVFAVRRLPAHLAIEYTEGDVWFLYEDEMDQEYNCLAFLRTHPVHGSIWILMTLHYPSPDSRYFDVYAKTLLFREVPKCSGKAVWNICRRKYVSRWLRMFLDYQQDQDHGRGTPRHIYEEAIAEFMAIVLTADMKNKDACDIMPCIFTNEPLFFNEDAQSKAIYQNIHICHIETHQHIKDLARLAGYEREHRFIHQFAFIEALQGSSTMSFIMYMDENNKNKKNDYTPIAYVLCDDKLYDSEGENIGKLNFYNITSLAVAPKFRRLGFAKKLLEHLLLVCNKPVIATVDCDEVEVCYLLKACGFGKSVIVQIAEGKEGYEFSYDGGKTINK